MLKRILFAVIPMVVAMGTVSANDDLLAKLAGMNEADLVNVSSDLEESDFGKADVDALLGEEEASGDEAIAACFRRIGYGYGRSYRYNSYSYGYNWCQPVYHHYTYYRPVHVYRPVYTCYTPIYTSYWGCY